MGHPRTRRALLCWALIAVAVVAGSQPAQAPPAQPGDFEQLSERLSRAEAELAARVLGPVPRLSAAELESLESLHREIEASYFAQLADRSRFLVLLARTLAAAPAGGAPPAALPNPPPPSRERPTRALLGTAAGAFGLSFSFWALAEAQDRLYLEAPTVERALLHRRLYVACGLASLVCAGVGVLSSGASVSLLLLDGG